MFEVLLGQSGKKIRLKDNLIVPSLLGLLFVVSCICILLVLYQPYKLELADKISSLEQPAIDYIFSKSAGLDSSSTLSPKSSERQEFLKLAESYLDKGIIRSIVLRGGDQQIVYESSPTASYDISSKGRPLVYAYRDDASPLQGSNERDLTGLLFIEENPTYIFREHALLLISIIILLSFVCIQVARFSDKKEKDQKDARKDLEKENSALLSWCLSDQSAQRQVYKSVLLNLRIAQGLMKDGFRDNKSVIVSCINESLSFIEYESHRKLQHFPDSTVELSQIIEYFQQGIENVRFNFLGDEKIIRINALHFQIIVEYIETIRKFTSMAVGIEGIVEGEQALFTIKIFTQKDLVSGSLKNQLALIEDAGKPLGLNAKYGLVNMIQLYVPVESHDKHEEQGDLSKIFLACFDLKQADINFIKLVNDDVSIYKSTDLESSSFDSSGYKYLFFDEKSFRKKRSMILENRHIDIEKIILLTNRDVIEAYQTMVYHDLGIRHIVASPLSMDQINQLECILRGEKVELNHRLLPCVF